MPIVILSILTYFSSTIYIKIRIFILIAIGRINDENDLDNTLTLNSKIPVMIVSVVTVCNDCTVFTTFIVI